MRPTLILLFVCAILITSNPLPLNSSTQDNKSRTKNEEKAGEGFALKKNNATPNNEPTPRKIDNENKPTTIRITEMPPNDRWYKTYVILTACLVFFACLGIGVAIATLRAINRQGAHIINSERAWVLAYIDQTMQKHSMIGQEVLSTLCTIKNVGKTPARIIAWTCKRKDTEIDALDSEPAYGDVQGFIPQVLAPGDNLSCWLTWLPEKFDQADRDKLFLYVFGFVSYEDGFGGPRETRFCFRYYPSLRDNKIQGFHVGGPPAYNRQT
jgi:hypothetical protein